MAKYIKGINPDILKWARERSGYTVEMIAESLDKDTATIEDWETGKRNMTYVQLETLADKYKRPIAIFFFSEPPKEDKIIDSLALRQSDIKKLKPKIHILLREAYARQLSLIELNSEISTTESRIFEISNIQNQNSPIELAKQIRLYLNVSLNEQTNWKNNAVAFERWRNHIEEKGIYIFKDAFKDDNIDGFCLIHNQFPVIYLNNSKVKVRQIFTLFHELGHILLQKNNVTGDILSKNKNDENFCNRFASEFLFPSEHFKKVCKNIKYSDTSVGKLAEEYKVSRQVILFKFLEQGFISEEEYQKKVNYLIKSYENREKTIPSQSSTSGNYYNTKATYLGYKFMELAFNAYYNKRCSIEQLADHLNVSVKNISGLEDCLLDRIARK